MPLAPSTVDDAAGLRDGFLAARDEVLKRVELRDRLLLTFFSTSIAILGGTMLAKDAMIGLLVPVFGFVTAHLVCQHTATVHYICCWTRRTVPFPHWARSTELQRLHRYNIAARAAAQAAIFGCPALVALAYGYPAAFAKTSVLLSGMWWSGIAFVIATASVQYRTFRNVTAINRETGYKHALRFARRSASSGGEVRSRQSPP